MSYWVWNEPLLREIHVFLVITGCGQKLIVVALKVVRNLKEYESRQPHKMVIRTKTIRQKQPTNCLSIAFSIKK